jgi:hypothetical protein
VPVCGEELGSAGGYVLLPGFSGGVGGGEVRGRGGQVCFVVFAWSFDGTDYHRIKKLMGYQVRDIIAIRVRASFSDRLHWCGLKGLD